MSISLYNDCIEELRIPPNKPRKINIISGYLSSLKNFMLLLKSEKENIKDILDKLSLVMRLRKTKKNEIIVNEGEKGREFFILLKGKVCVLTPKINEYYMTDEEYILYLFQLRLNDQNELIQKSISLNQTTYPISEDDFDSFVYNLTIGKTINQSYSKNNNLIKKSKEVYEHICEQKEKYKSMVFDNRETIITPEEYIIQNLVPDEIIKNTTSIKHYLKNLETGINLDYNEISNDTNTNANINKKKENEKNKELLSSRNIIFIPSHEIFGNLDTGCYFGEKALEEKGIGKRHATLISLDDCYIGAIEKKDYFFLLHFFIEKAQNKYINFISSYYVFKNMTLAAWEKKYLTFFFNKIYDKDYLLLKEGEKIDKLYFTYKGTYEITTNKNLLEVNELIIHFKKVLLKLLQGSTSLKYNYKKKMIKYCSFNEELKQNDNFIVNKKFEGEKFRQMVFDRKTIKLGIVPSKEIIGLLDVYSNINEKKNNNDENKFRIKNYEMVSLFDCRCMSCDCEVYSFPLNKFKDICENEDKVDEFTNEIEIRKVFYMIKRLIHYKNFLFENLNKKENENVKDNIIIQLRNYNKGKKNKFESNKEFSNLNFKKGIFNTNNEFIKRKKTHYFNNFSEKKIFSSFSNTYLNSFDNKNIKNLKNIEKEPLNQTNSKFPLNKEKLKIKQKILNLPTIDDIGKGNDKDKIDTNDKTKQKTEKEMQSISQRGKIKSPKKPSNKKNNYNLKNKFLENKKIEKNILPENNNLDSNRLMSQGYSTRNNFINVDNITNILNKRQSSEQNWVAKVLIDNLVYNHIFDKYAFSSVNNSNNKFNSTSYNLKTNLKNPLNNNNENYSRNKKIVIKSQDKILKNKDFNYKQQSNIFLKKCNKSLSISNLSKENKIKNLKLDILNNKNKVKVNNGIKNNGIYDVLVFDNFNKCFNETVYNKFYEE